MQPLPSLRLLSDASKSGRADTVGADATRCYCEDAAPCPGSGKGCGPGATANASAQPLGNSEGNCATPHALYESAVRFMASTTPHLAGGLYFTGDFVEAGAADAW